MSISEIKKYYKLFALLCLGVSIIMVLTFTQAKLSERIISAIFLNFSNHMTYLFMDNTYFDLKWIKRNNSNFGYNLVKAMMKLFSFMAMISAILIAIYLLYSSVANHDYFSIYFLFIPIGLFLGGYSLMLKLYGNE